MDLADKLLGHAFTQTEAALLVILCGGAFLFFGVRLYRIFAVFAGMAVGAVLGGMFGEIIVNFSPELAGRLSGNYSIIPMLAGAVVLGALAVTMSRMALSLLVGAGGFYIAFKIGMEWGPATAIAAGAIAYIIAAFLTMHFFNHIIMVLSALFGVCLALCGTMNFLAITRREMFERIVGHYQMTLFVAALALFVVGLLYQAGLERRRVKHA